MVAASRALAELGLQPHSGIGPLDLHVRLAREIDCAVEARETLRLVGPDVGPQAQELSGIVDVQRVEVTGGAVADARRRFDGRRRAAPIGVDLDGTLASPPPRLRAVAEAVPAHVETGAGADLKQVDQTLPRLREREEACEQRNRAAYFVGLRRRGDELGNPCLLAREKCARGGPILIHAPFAARVWIDPRELSVTT